PHALERIPPHVDAPPLLQCEREAWKAMVEHCRFDHELVLLQDETEREPARLDLLACERSPGAKARAAGDAAIELVNQDREIEQTFIEQVPGIASELGGDAVDKVGRSGEMERLGAVQADPQQRVEA